MLKHRQQTVTGVLIKLDQIASCGCYADKVVERNHRRRKILNEIPF